MSNERLPLRELMNEIEERMRQMNYGEASIYAYWCCWRELLQYAEKKGAKYFSVKLGEDFLLEKCHVDVYSLDEKPDMPKWKIRAFKRPIYVLAEYQSSGTIVRKNRMHRTEIPDRFREAAEHYAAVCYERYNAEQTVSSRLYMLKRFLLFLDQISIDTLSEINGTHISEFTKTMIGWSQRTIGNSLATLRHFFRFLYLERYLPNDLSLSVPRVNCGRTAKLPKIWTPDEVERILTAVDRGTSAGKRDYAILLMVTHLGLRDSDIQNLKFENIQWENCCIRINQSKTGQLLELPLNEELGNAIIDYLKYGRPLQDTSQYE